MTEKQANITAGILTGLLFILFILAFKYIAAVLIILFCIFLYMGFTILF